MKKVRECWDAAAPVHKHFTDRWDTYYGLYRNYREFVDAYAGAGTERDRDAVINDLRRAMGAQLFIPYCFATIETIVPRVLANDPTMLAVPSTPEAKHAVEPVQQAIKRQQLDIGYDLILQPSARRGFKYGLGVQKTYWREKKREKTVVKKSVKGRVKKAIGLSSGYQAVDEKVTLFRGPYAEDVDIWDFFWDPAGKDIESCEWVIHRTWRSYRYVEAKIKSGEWGKVKGKDINLDLEKIKEGGSENARGETWQGRQKAAGQSDYKPKGAKEYEVWEYHDREYVYTVLDKSIIVQAEPTPFYHRELPFQIFRPTIQEGEFVGIGEIEPIAHLQYELNTMRSQRLDANTVTMNPWFMYAEGLVDPEDLVIGPGYGIPTLGDPREALEMGRFPDLPASGIELEEALKSDIERTTGISDPVSGGEGSTSSSETATGIQLIQQAANVRIRLKAMNLLREMVRPAARQWLELNRQHNLKPMPVRVPKPDDEEPEFTEVTPEHWQAELELIPDAGSTEPENIPQKRNDAMTRYNLLRQDPNVDQRRNTEALLKDYDVADPESWLVPDRPQIDMDIVQALALEFRESGMPQPMVMKAVEKVLMQLTAQGFEIKGAEQQAPPGQNGGPPPSPNGNEPQPDPEPVTAPPEG